MTKQKTGILAIIIFVCIVIVMFAISVMRKNHSYNQALNYMNNGKYEQAEEMFLQLDDYRDSKNNRLEAIYKKASAKKENCEYEDAITLFESLGEYKDSQEVLKDTIFLYALSLLEDEKYTEAVEQFQRINPHNDSENKMQEAIYQRGKQYLDEKKYEKALEDFAVIKGYQDSEELIVESNYQIALEMLNGENAGDARDIFLSLGNYKNSKALLNKFKYVRLKEIDNDILISNKKTITYKYDKYGNFEKGEVVEENSSSDTTTKVLDSYQPFAFENWTLSETKKFVSENPDYTYNVTYNSDNSTEEVTIYDAKGERFSWVKNEYNSSGQIVRYDCSMGEELKGIMAGSGRIYSLLEYDDLGNVIEESTYGYSDNKLISTRKITYGYIYVGG